MLIHPWDAGMSDEEWVTFVRSQGFGHLVAAGRDRSIPVVVPTQFVLTDPALVVLHLARPNPIWAALAENDQVVLSIAGDWAYIPAAWKAIAEEDPRRGVPTTYYAAVQLVGSAVIVDDHAGKAEILRTQLAATEPGSGRADPDEDERVLKGIRGIRLRIHDVRTKFKYGGNVDDTHRAFVAQQLEQRSGPGDAAALGHLRRRTPLPGQ